MSHNLFACEWSCLDVDENVVSVIKQGMPVHKWNHTVGDFLTLGFFSLRIISSRSMQLVARFNSLFLLFFCEVKAYLALFYYTWETLLPFFFFFFFFLQIEGLWTTHLSIPFFNSICSLHVSVSHYDNSHNTSNFFISIIFVMVTCDPWSLMLPL